MVDAMEGNPDIPEFYDMMRTVAKLADESADVVDEGLRAITRYGNFEFWFTEQGQAAAWVMKNVVDTDPKLLNKMVLDIAGEASKAKKMAKMLVYSDNLSTEWTKKFFPTLEEQLKLGTKAGKKLPSHLRAAAKAHKQSRKVYGPMLNLFSEMYLGRTPGYAVRNAVQNFGQTIFDLGIDSVDGFKYVDDMFDWAGIERAVDAGKIAGTQAGNVAMVGMERGLGALTQYQDVAKGKKRFLDFKWWSNEAEKLGGRVIFGKVYPEFMKNAMAGPMKRQFVKMGVSPADAKHWQNLIIKYKGDVRGAAKQIAKEAEQGFRRTLAVSGFTPELQKTIDAFRLRTKIDNIIDTAGSKEEAIETLRAYGKRIMQQAEDSVIKEGTNSPAIQEGSESLGRLATAVMDGDVDKAACLAEQGWLVTFGIPPERPETGYGYIEVADKIDPGFRVRKFKEKPDESTARSFLSQGNHYWNSGMFAFRADRFLEELDKHAPEVARPFFMASPPEIPQHSPIGKTPIMLPVGKQIEEIYRKTPSISIDYAVMEHSDHCAAVPAHFSWSDVGSWDVVAELFGSELEKRQAEHLITVEAEGNFVLSDLPVALAGVKDLIVIVKNGVVLVCKRGKTQLVKDVVQTLKDTERSDLL